MKSTSSFHGYLLGGILAASAILLARPTHAQIPAAHKTQNVIVVMMDGMRWQEIFRGADPKLIAIPGPKWVGDPEEMAADAQAKFIRPTASDSRKALMPFLWNVIAKQGQIFGNRDLGSDSHVTTIFNFSYPGYAETLTGIADPSVDSNDNKPNPNPTVFTWLNARPEFAGKAAAFGAWSVFDGIFDKDRCGFVVNAAFEPLTSIPMTHELALLNAMKAETPQIWSGESFDALPFHTAIEYLKAKKPRVLFIGLGEPDDWAHAGAYPEYLISAHLGDSYLRQIWEMVQSMPEYRDKTTLIVLPDHGRGEGEEWTTHGQKVPASRETWMAFLGPDTQALGERGKGTQVTESQIAATVAAFLSEDYHAAIPQSGTPIADVLGK